uniref:Uncharacterized protein n=1 Tax=Oryza barthii TaxID=65489 RepID=A0A0D3ENW4_9ORYZ
MVWNSGSSLLLIFLQHRRAPRGTCGSPSTAPAPTTKLEQRKAADSLPENVVVGMNFSLIDPWNSALKCAHKWSGSSSRRTGDVMRQE